MAPAPTGRPTAAGAIPAPGWQEETYLAGDSVDPQTGTASSGRRWAVAGSRS